MLPNRQIFLPDPVYATSQFAIHYTGRRHPHANRFRQFEQRRREAQRVTRKEPVNSGRPRTPQTPADKDATITVV